MTAAGVELAHSDNTPGVVPLGHDADALRAPVRCREIMRADIEAVTDLLTRGFGPTRQHWQRAMARLNEYQGPEGYPKYGYLLESGSQPVGVLLLIFAQTDNGIGIRCNVSSWYVEPAFRSYGPLLARYATRRKEVTYFNLTPAPSTWAMLRAEGYQLYAQGRIAAIPMLARSHFQGPVYVREWPVADTGQLTSTEVKVLADHARYGCTSLVCEADGQCHPFVLALRSLHGVLPAARLVYCRDVQQVALFARPLGQFLARHGCLFLVLESNGPIAGLVGRYTEHSPKFFKGPHAMRPGDIAYSEQVMFGDWSNSRELRT